MDLKTAKRIFYILTDDISPEDFRKEWEKLKADGIVRESVTWLSDACRVAVECMEFVERMEDDGK